MSRGSQDIADVTLVCDLLSRAEGGVVFERPVGGESGKRGKEVRVERSGLGEFVGSSSVVGWLPLPGDRLGRLSNVW